MQVLEVQEARPLPLWVVDLVDAPICEEAFQGWVSVPGSMVSEDSAASEVLQDWQDSEGSEG